MTLLSAGVYKGRISDYGVKRTSKGDPAPTIVFDVAGPDGSTQRVFWQGSWNGNAMDYCMEALLVCGLRSQQDLVKLADGKSSGVLDTDATFDLTIEVDVNQNDPSKRYNKIRWINAEGGKKFKDTISSSEFAMEVTGRNLAADLMRVAQAKGYNLKSQSQRERPVFQPAQIPF